MPVITLSEKGLSVDALSEEPFVLPSEAYVLSKDTVISVRQNGVDFVSLYDKKLLKSCPLSGYSEMKVSKDGRKVAILCCSGKLHLFIDQAHSFEIEDVRKFSVSDNFLIVSSLDRCRIYKHSTKELLLDEKMTVETVYAMNKYVLYLVRGKTSYSVMFFKNNESVELLTRQNIYRMAVEESQNEESCLITVDVEYTKDSYYANSVLYILWTGENLKKEENKGEPLLVKSTPHFQLLLFSSLNMIHMCKFLDNNVFFVCFGPQPANLRLFTEKGEYIKSFPKTTRNRVSFSANRSRILNAGLGNLPGNIEVFDGDDIACKFEKLGTSVAEWMPDGTHFILATKNYFKSDNGLALYDYYGRCIKEVPYESLAQVDIYGKPEEPKTLKEPEQKNIMKPAEVYVPPHLQNVSNSKPKTKTVPKPAARKESIKKVMTKEELDKEIAHIKELKQRLANGEDLGLEDQKKVFTLKSLLERYEKS